MIRAPYNFVPVSEKVFFPDRTDQISHDVPFEDGESGTITVKMTAHSPIYVRNGHKQGKEDTSFSKDSDGKYFIPGTSIKGMIRSVLEIMSFGKMGQKKSNGDGKFVDNRRYGIRNLYYKPYISKMTSTEKGRNGNIVRSNVKSGWLQKDKDDNWTLNPCQYVRVEITDLESFYGKSIGIGMKQSSVDKYNKWSKPLAIRFKTNDGPFNHVSCGWMEYTKAIGLGKGDNEGTIVFTGQASDRKQKNTRWVGKHMEFIFYKSEDNSIDINHIKKDFCFIHSNDKGLPNEEWKYWKEKLNSKKRVPVFYLEKDGKVKSMGLAMMYRLAYDNTVHDLLPDEQLINNDSLDLAECIFGTEEGAALRGRVQFSIAKAYGRPKGLDEKTVVLGSPKPTYYPNYINQDGRNGVTSSYKTFMNKEARLKGRKRYPIHKEFKEPKELLKETNKKGITTTFVPLSSGSEFVFKVRYHNLREFELGAILTALTFYGQSNRFYHSIGMAKPLGYGKVQLEIQEIESSELNHSNMNTYMNKFIDALEKKLQIKWKTSKEIIEFFTIAKEQDNQIGTSSELSYMNLDTDNKINDFTNATRNEQYLLYYSEMKQYGIVSVNLKTISDFIDEYKNFSGKNFVEKALKSQGDEKEAVLLILKDNGYNPDWNSLYQKYQTDPYIAFLILKNTNLKHKEIVSKINDKHEEFDKYRTVIFDFYFEEILKKTIPDEGFPKYLKPFVYTWDVLIKADSKEKDILGIIDGLELRTWPPKKDLRPYLESIPELRAYVDYVD